MKKLLAALILATGFALPAVPALAAPGAAGFPQVVQGDRLQFGSMIVELFGIRAPQPGMICRAGNISYQCDVAATQALDRIIENYAIACQQVSDTQLFPMLTECRIGQTDLNRLILRAGWALVDMNSCDGNPSCPVYLADQAFAKENSKGMWMGTPPETLVALTRRNGTSGDMIAYAPFTIDLAAESRRPPEPDRTLLSFLMP